MPEIIPKRSAVSLNPMHAAVKYWRAKDTIAPYRPPLTSAGGGSTTATEAEFVILNETEVQLTEAGP